MAGEDLRVRIGADLGGLNSAMAQAGRAVQKFAQDATLASGQIKQAEQATGSFTKSIGSLKAIAVSYFAAVGGFKAIKYISDATHLAGRYEQMGIAMNQAGQNVGYTSQQMAELEVGLQKTGIAMIESRETLTRMAACYMDLSKATQLARAAQDLAVVGGMNSSEAFRRLTYAIQSGQVEMLRTIGLNVTFEEGYKKTAAALGKNVDQLTNQEKLLSRTNVALEGAKGYVGLYEQSMNSAEKQFMTLARYVENYKVKLGEAFQPAYLEMVRAQTEQYKIFSNVVSDPAIQQSLTNLGNLFGGVATRAIKWLKANEEAIKQNLPKLIDLITIGFKMLGEAASVAWRIVSAIPSGLIEFIINLSAKTDEATESLNKLSQSAKEMKPPTSWDQFWKGMALWGEDIVDVFTFMGKAAGNLFAVMVADAIATVKMIGEQFVILGNLISSALSFNFDGIKNVWAEIGKSDENFHRELRTNWESFETGIVGGWDTMYTNMEKRHGTFVARQKEAVQDLPKQIKLPVIPEMEENVRFKTQFQAPKTDEAIKAQLDYVKQMEKMKIDIMPTDTIEQQLAKIDALRRDDVRLAQQEGQQKLIDEGLIQEKIGLINANYSKQANEIRVKLAEEGKLDIDKLNDSEFKRYVAMEQAKTRTSLTEMSKFEQESLNVYERLAEMRAAHNTTETEDLRIRAESHTAFLAQLLQGQVDYNVNVDEMRAADFEALVAYEEAKAQASIDQMDRLTQAFVEMNENKVAIAASAEEQIINWLYQGEAAFTETEKRKRQVQVDQTKKAIDNASYFFKWMGEQNKIAFAVFKGIEIARATIAGIAAAVAAWEAGMSVGGPYAPIVAAAYMAASIATTAAQIAQIASIEPGGAGGGAGVAATGGGAGQAVGTYNAEPLTGLPASETQNKIEIHIHGDMLADDYYIERLFEKASEMAKDGTVRIYANEAEMAQGVRG